MHVTVATLLALQCTLCHAIRVPIAWNDESSEVNKPNQFAYEQFAPQNVASSNQKPIPSEYFQYTAQKPKFAADIAKLHGVQSPEQHYEAYPIKPHTGVPKPELGKHRLPNNEKNIFHPHHELSKKNEAIRIVSPSITNFEVFHPYKLEEPALKELYRDPVMQKIRKDLENNKNRLQKYEIEAGHPDVHTSEYLESPEETDRKKVPHKNVPAPYEIHRPQRRPVYYRPPFVYNQREQVLNQKLRHPWHQNHIKVKPAHYRPVKNHLQRLRQQHALKYDDDQNEYPQLPILENHNEAPEGYDIYEKGKDKFVELRNNVDEFSNTAVHKNRPENQNLELNDDDKNEEDTNTDDEEDEFVPVKNYAQVRKTETTKHLPKEAAYHDADTLEEIQNAPRLREAIKSSKAQTVYSEEGYEDSAYDHAGEQKHASDHEEHRGSLKEKEKSNGKFKAPTLSNKFEDEKGFEYRNQVLDGKKWKDTKENTDKETDVEEYSENEQEDLNEKNTYNSKYHENDENEDVNGTNYESAEDEVKRIKREPTNFSNTSVENSSNNSKHNNFENEEDKDIFEIEDPEIKLNATEQKSTIKVKENVEDIHNKYPYYYNKFKGIYKDSPLRYAENLKFIPKKSEGGTEFYDSRAKLQCPEVEDNIDPIPEKLKKDGHPDDDEEDEYDDTEDSKEKIEKPESRELLKTPRLNGLGDKIDCFKAKYFGENPLDSPFFKEEIISNPEPVTIPSIDIYRLKQEKQKSQKIKPKYNPYLKHSNQNHIPTVLKTKITANPSISVSSDDILKPQVYTKSDESTANHVVQQKHDKRYLKNVNTRKRRAAPFVYEPYKIIRDSQIQDSKKTTTTNNISPLIKQLQSSRVVDKVAPANTGKDQIVKRSAGIRAYKDIGKIERDKNNDSKGSQPLYDASFVDVSVDNRRGEPRYELRTVSHKNQDSIAENERSTTAQSKTLDEQEDKSQNKRKTNRRRRPTTTTTRPYFDVSKFLPQGETHKSDAVKSKIELPSNQPIISQSDKSQESNDDTIEYARSSSTTAKPPSRRKVIDTPTKIKTDTEDDLSLTELPKLRLVTRFQNSYETENPVTSKYTEFPTHGHEDIEKIKGPKYRAKKKKISKSTLVTDTNSYGEDDDDDDDDRSKEGEVDALIGVKHDIEEYLPTYEIDTSKKDSSSDSQSDSEEVDEEDDEEDDHSFDDEDDENNEENDDEGDDEDENVDDDEEDEFEEDSKPEITTALPTKRTLIKTTEAPLTTTEAHSAKLKIEPVVFMKKLDVHKELPVNRSSPHVTEFKQDIKEVEIIKEIPSRKKNIPQKNIEALELYKDENLAKDINKLGGVEVFKEDLDLVNGPKHGGNYRSAEVLTTDNTPRSSSLRNPKETSSIGDVIASPSKTSRIIETKDDPHSRRRSDIQRARNNRNRSARLIELSDADEKTTSRPMHGGNFRSIHDMRRRGGTRNAKFVELIDLPSRDNHSTNKHESNSRSYGSRGGGRHQMHGGNYRSAKLTKEDDNAYKQTEKVPKKESSTDVRQNSAVLLNSFARAVSVLTTPTPYILDPSKRMYYYVEA